VSLAGAGAHGQLRDLYRELGDYAQAEAHLEKVKSLDQPEIWEEDEGKHRGWFCLFRNDPAAARTWFKQRLPAVLEQHIPRDATEAYISLGYACLRANEPGEAAEAFQKALAIHQKLAEPHGVAEAQAGLAAALLAQGDPAGARAALVDVPAFLEANPVLMMVRPELAYLNCCQVLAATDAPLAQQMLQAATQYLQKRAATIPTEALRQSYWQNVPWNREIKELYQAGKVC
jgi:tetratricopeptide (TPR) repeat protein